MQGPTPELPLKIMKCSMRRYVALDWFVFLIHFQTQGYLRRGLSLLPARVAIQTLGIHTVADS